METDLPDELAALVRDLRSVGYSLTVESLDQIELRDEGRRAGRGVRLEKERGWYWSGVTIELRADRWYSPYAITEAIRGNPYSTRALSHAERHVLALEAVAALADRATDLGVVGSRLREYHEAYWRRFRRE